MAKVQQSHPSKSQQMAAERQAKAEQRGRFLGTFTVIDRPAHRGAVVELGPIHKAVLETLNTKKAVHMPLGQGVEAQKVFRMVRTPLRQTGSLNGNVRIRRIIGPNSLAIWIEPKPEKKPKKK